MSTSQMSTWEPELEAPLTKRQLKRRRNKDSKLAKKIKNLEKENSKLKSQMEELEDKITKASESTNARFKRKKIRSMKREVGKINEKLRESEVTLKSLESRIPKDPISGAPFKLHPPNRNKCINAKIAELNKKIRRVKNIKNKERLIAKRNSLRLGPRLLEGAFSGAYRRYRIDGISGMDPDTFLNRIRRFLIDLLKKESRMGAVRSHTTTWIRFRKDRELVELAFNSRMTNVYNLSNLDEIVNEMIAHMKGQIENPTLLNSKFIFDEVILTNVDFHQLSLTRGSSYIPLPDWLMKEKAIINPRNEDQECFKWAVIAAMRWRYIDSHPERISNLTRFEADFDWSGIEFPVSIKDIKKFELRNNISINLLAIEGKQTYICRKGCNYESVINLMIITENDRKHYVAIKSLSMLLSTKNTNHKGKEYFCMNCLQGFKEERSRDKHIAYCINKDSVKVEMPHKNPIVRCSDGQYQFKVPYIMYADFESILEPIQGPENDPRISSTRSINNHVPSAWCVRSEFAYGKVKNPLKLYRGKDCVKKFCEHVIGEARRLYKSFPEKPMKPLTLNEMYGHKKSERCHICFKKFEEDNPKVKDHCHYTARYRGAAHMKCNLQYKIPSYIPIVFHNLSGYDAHLFIKELAAYSTEGEKMGVIAKNKEDYISFSIKVEVDKYIDKNGIEKSKEIELRFIDSFKLMSSSLDSLVNNLSRGGGKFFGFEDYNENQYKLLIKKGIYPYEYMSNWDKFKETKLPQGKLSKLNMAGVREEDYEHAFRVWKEFGLKHLGEYHDLYLKTDVILLANVFEEFRKVCLKNYGLDPAHFYTAPGLAWKTCLTKTRIRLELLLDPDMLLMFKRGIRGGITQSVNR